MRARQFCLKPGYTTATSRAARLATVYPITLCTAGSFRRPTLAFFSTLRAWRKHCKESGFDKGINCTPSMYTIAGSCHVYCNQRWLCPWCRGRTIVGLARAIGLGDPAHRRLIWGGYDLYLLERVYPATLDIDELRGTLLMAADQFRVFWREHDIRALLWSVDCGLGNGDKILDEEQRVIYDADPAQPVVRARALLAKKRSVELPRRPWAQAYQAKQDLVQALARVYRYPAEILTAEPKVAAIMLQAREKLRLNEVAGKFRKAGVRLRKQPATVEE